MTQEDKKLLLKDLCARVPYHPKGRVVNNFNGSICDEWLTCATFTMFTNITNNCRLYLRPMSSMTDEEKEELLNRLPKYWSLEIDKLGDLYFDICDASYPDIELLTDIIDWLNAHHFDYRGLIEKRLALEAKEGIYNII